MEVDHEWHLPSFVVWTRLPECIWLGSVRVAPCHQRGCAGAPSRSTRVQRRGRQCRKHLPVPLLCTVRYSTVLNCTLPGKRGCLYDIMADPTEHHDLAEANAAIASVFLRPLLGGPPLMSE